MEKVNRGSESTIVNANTMHVVTVGKRGRIRSFLRLYPIHVLLTLLTYSLVLVMIAVIIPKFCIEKTQVVGASMEDTLSNGDDIVIDKLSYRFVEPERYDVIVFYPKGDTKGDYLVKRVIGLPEETVQIINGRIYIDGKELEEDYGTNAMLGGGIAEIPILLKEDEYFVLGDNRIISRDSRYKSVGIVKREYIVGRAWLKVSPFDEFGAVE